MALRTGTAADLTTGLHAGKVRLGVAGLADPSGNDWIVMNDPAVAPGGIVNALTLATGATGTGVTLSVGGNNADANRSITIVGAGTGATIVGSSVSPVTLAGAPTVSSNLTVSGTLTVTGTMTTSNINSSGIITSTSALHPLLGASSSQFTGILFASSALMPSIQVGSSIPTSAGVPGSLFLNAGGSSTAVAYIAGPNAGTASSSNWTPITLA